jgi:hypothetical protein
MHKFDIEMTAAIDSSTAMAMVIEAVEKQTGKKVNNVYPIIDEGKFKGFEIKFDSQLVTKKMSFTPSKEFIVTHFDEN